MKASTSKRARVELSGSEDPDSSIRSIDEATGGLDSGEESEIDRFLENESQISR